jgi:hypothetical protein
MSKPHCSGVLEAIDPFKIEDMHVDVVCIWMSQPHYQHSSHCYHFLKLPRILVVFSGANHSIVLSLRLDPFKMAPTSISNTEKVFHNPQMLWMCIIWISLYRTTTAIIVNMFGIQNSGCLMRSKSQPEAQHGAIIEDRPIQDGSHINVKHM